MVPWLDADQPIYAIDSYNCNHLEAPETDLPALARRYVEHVRKVQSCGPYLLGGYSAGGNIAYEMAHQLVSRGEHVERLYLIDSVLLGATAAKARVSDRDAADFLDYFELREPEDETLIDLARTEMTLLFRHRPPRIPNLRIVLIQARDLMSPLDALDEDHIAKRIFQVGRPFGGWDAFAREVHRYEVPANHKTIMEDEHLGAVTRIIQTDINSERVHEMCGTWS